MRVVYNDMNLRISWKHVREPHHTLQGGKLKSPKLCNGETTCIVQKDEKQGEVILIGKAWCSMKEPYNKDRGRKASLAVALKQISRCDRIHFWIAYFESTADKDCVLDKIISSL